MALRFIFATFLFGSISAHACLKGADSVLVGATKSEYSADDLKKVSDFSRRRFQYVNPTISSSSCYVALTLEEKLDQQAGRSFADLLKPQLVGYRNWKWAQWLERSKLQEWAGSQPVGHYIEALKMPYLPLHLRRVRAVRAAGYAAESAVYGTKKSGDDEGDALRHYFGSFALTMHLGPWEARKITNLQEKDIVRLASIMDRYNNSIAIADAASFWRSGNKISDEEIIARARAAVESGRLVRLRSSKGAPVDYRNHRAFVAWAHSLLRARLY